MPNPFPHPVIFIPGIMGSALRDQYPIDPEAVWSPFKLLVKAYERVTLHPSNTRYELIEPSRVSPDQVFGLVYSELIEELRHNLSPQADQPSAGVSLCLRLEATARPHRDAPRGLRH